jgi:hypothetical protein
MSRYEKNGKKFGENMLKCQIKGTEKMLAEEVE